MMVADPGRIEEWRTWFAYWGFEIDLLGERIVIEAGARYALPFEQPPLRPHWRDRETVWRWLEAHAPRAVTDRFVLREPQ
ncbi:MAG: hypothetical protein AAF763_10050 [Pseudomonadota bacterium]